MRNLVNEKCILTNLMVIRPILLSMNCASYVSHNEIIYATDFRSIKILIMEENIDEINKEFLKKINDLNSKIDEKFYKKGQTNNDRSRLSPKIQRKRSKSVG